MSHRGARGAGPQAVKTCLEVGYVGLSAATGTEGLQEFGQTRDRADLVTEQQVLQTMCELAKGGGSSESVSRQGPSLKQNKESSCDRREEHASYSPKDH